MHSHLLSENIFKFHQIAVSVILHLRTIHKHHWHCTSISDYDQGKIKNEMCVVYMQNYTYQQTDRRHEICNFTHLYFA